MTYIQNPGIRPHNMPDDFNSASVDMSRCIGCGFCSEVCSELFELHNGSASVILSPIPPDLRGSCLQASRECPMDAISLQRQSS